MTSRSNPEHLKHGVLPDDWRREGTRDARYRWRGAASMAAVTRMGRARDGTPAPQRCAGGEPVPSLA